MNKTLMAIAVTAITAATPAHAQDANAMFAQQNAIMQRQMAEMQNRIVTQNMRDPRIVAMYRQAQARGYRGSLQQFAYGYAATGGYTPEGRARYSQNEANNRAREQGAMRDYQEAVRNYGSAVRERNAHAAQNQYDGGLNLQGRQRYYDPATGTQSERSYQQPGDTGYDARTGRYYRQDAQGNYYSCSNTGCVRMRPAR